MQFPSFPEHDLSQLGSSASHPFHDLNLAGAQGVPAPTVLAASSQPATDILPDFSAPDTTPVPLQPHSVTGLSLTLFSPFAPDPLLPDASAYPRPYALDIYSGTTLSDPLLTGDIASQEELNANLASGLGFSSVDVQNGFVPDILMPELHSPDLIIPLPDVELDGRPGDLDPSALDALHANNVQPASSHYPSVWMDQRGMNATRSRHLTLLDDGLDNGLDGIGGHAA